MRKILFTTLILGLFVAACGASGSEPGMGSPGNGMSARHHATVPKKYADLKSPSMTQTDIENGGRLYTGMCASCHGDGGMGDGPAASELDPAPAAIALSITMLGDGYLYWRIADGGNKFRTSMPAWKESLSEQEIWSMIAYMRELGSDVVAPSSTECWHNFACTGK